MLRTRALIMVCALMAGYTPALAQDAADINAKIRKEETENSQVMRTMHFLTDVYGPRLTGSPNLKAAGEWAIKQMTAWGFENGHLEPWDFGHPGWANERFSGFINSPVKDTLTCEVLSWTPGTNGPVTAKAHQMTLPEKPTQEEFTAYLATQKDKVKGKIVLAGKQQIVPVTLTPPARRQDDKQAKERYDPNNPNAGQGGRGGPRGNQPQPEPGKLTTRQIDEQLDQFLIAGGALIRVNDAGREHRQIRAFNNRTFDAAKALPTVVMSNEDYGRISRILGDGTPVELEFNIVNRWFPEGKTAYNTVAEIPGTDKKDEVVMLGGHLDSWHSATGATDNAIGCAVMMEAARILKAIGVKPRRTIRVALWGGEEQGLLGSQAYVKQHFGTFEEPKPEYTKFAGYFNVDSGTGRVRGASVFGPPEAAAILRQALAPFEDLGVMGALPSKSRALGGTDSTSFSQAGLPGIGLGQDPIEYNSATWHTNMDSYERIIEEDAKKSAIAVAAALYQLAMRDELLPRFSKEMMPPLPPKEGTPTPATTATPTPQARPGNNCTSVQGSGFRVQSSLRSLRFLASLREEF
jgi:carboxypeptidase Q